MRFHFCYVARMSTVNLSQFASLFEIGFALHFAVAFLDRIYAKELPVRIDAIAARAKALEQLKETYEFQNAPDAGLYFTDAYLPDASARMLK